MSQPSRPQARVPAQRTRRSIRLEAVRPLEDRSLPAPFIPIFSQTATFTPFPNQPNNQNLGTVNIAQGPALTTSAAAYTSVAQFAPASEFDGNIVRIQAGPGGDFGKGVYAITRGAGDNAGQPGVVDRPGVIYRLDPATGKAYVFFDLNSVINQIEPGNNASNGLLPSTGLLNWYDIAFDSEGYFDGRPSMFVTSVSRDDPAKNVVYRIGPDGSFLGLFVKFTDQTSGAFNFSPTSVFVPPPELQQFFRGLFVGSDQTPVAFFDANQFRPGQAVSGTALPAGATFTAMTLTPQVAITAANADYNAPIYSVFTDFGVPQGGGLPGTPGISGVQGFNGGLLISSGGTNFFANGSFPISGPPADVTLAGTQPTGAAPSGIDQFAAIATPYRRFQDAAFDYYGYFSYGTDASGLTTTPISQPPPASFAGSLFVSDLASGLAVSVALPQNVTPAGNVVLPVQGPGTTGVVNDPNSGLQFQLAGGNLGGRIIRIRPDGTVTVFAAGFRTNGSYTSDSFENSSLSITFSADGTTLYAADDDGIWQFKTVTSLAGSSTGSLVGLNDLRTLGVPYEGQDLAVSVVDTGIDARTPNFRGRVATGTNVFTNGPGDDDTSTTVNLNGHGTLVAGVIAQFVPQATLVPVNIFATNDSTTNQLIFNGLDYLAKNPFVNDPVRPNQVSRQVAVNLGFGTSTTFDTEATAFRKYPQIVASFKGQMHRLRKLGIQPIAATGQFGVPTGGTNPNGANAGDFNGSSLLATLNETISVTGSYPFPYTATAATTPNDSPFGVYPRPVGPVLITNIATVTGNGTDVLGNATALAAGDQLIFRDKILVAANRSFYTDFTAPAMNIPTFQRTASVANAGFGPAHLVFTEAGTSLSSAMVTGAYATVASALDYWSMISKNGTTVDGYLTTPVGVRQLNFAPHDLYDPTAYANPDGINSILQWTAVPAVEQVNSADNLTSPPFNRFSDVKNLAISRVDIGNAIAAIEGTEALNYLFAHGTFSIIDANQNGLITAQEIQDFVDKSAAIGMPEAGAMARLLGGTARTGTVRPTAAGELPDQPDALQRRYNLLDYSADGQLNGVISIDQLRVLAHYLLPSPDAFQVTDRQRASLDKYLVDANQLRDYNNLAVLKPRYVWVSPGQARRFGHISPNRFGVGRRVAPNLVNPVYALFDKQEPKAPKAGNSRGSNRNAGSGNSNAGSGSTNTGSGGSNTGSGNSNSGSGSSNTGSGGSNSGGSTTGGTTGSTTTGNSNSSGSGGTSSSTGSNSSANPTGLLGLLASLQQNLGGQSGTTTGAGGTSNASGSNTKVVSNTAINGGTSTAGSGSTRVVNDTGSSNGGKIV